MKALINATTVLAISLGLATQARAQVPSSTVGAQGATAEPDREFIQAAAESGRAEAALAEAAQHRTMQPSVRQLAGRLLQDHQAVNRELAAMAKARQIDIPDISAQERSTQQRLENLSGEAFDREYVASMVKAHDASMARFMAAAKSGDAMVRAFAERTLATLRAHMLEVEKTRKAIGGTEKPT